MEGYGMSVFFYSIQSMGAITRLSNGPIMILQKKTHTETNVIMRENESKAKKYSTSLTNHHDCHLPMLQHFNWYIFVQCKHFGIRWIVSTYVWFIDNIVSTSFFLFVSIWWQKNRIWIKYLLCRLRWSFQVSLFCWWAHPFFVCYSIFNKNQSPNWLLGLSNTHTIEIICCFLGKKIQFQDKSSVFKEKH